MRRSCFKCMHYDVCGWKPKEVMSSNSSSVTYKPIISYNEFTKQLFELFAMYCSHYTELEIKEEERNEEKDDKDS